MRCPSIRAILLSCVIAAGAATPGSAKDGEDKADEAKAKPVAGMSCPTCGSSINRKGGTAIINFVAPVSSKTMAELAMMAQNAVIGGADAIRINISSRGGSVHAMQFGVNVLKSLPVPVETVAMSQIASAAVALFCAGEARYMADGSGLYLHQKRGFEEIQHKTVAAVMRQHELDRSWYNGLLDDCMDGDADKALLDYSSQDVVIDVAQAESIGLVTGPVVKLDPEKTWGLVINVVAPESAHGSAYPFSPYR